MSKAIPWDDCKVAFGIANPEPLGDGGESYITLPPGWELTEIDGAGARWVAVFRVDGIPTVADGRTVRAALRKVGAL